MRTVLLTRLARIPFVKVSSCLGQQQHYSQLTDGALFLHLFVLKPLLDVEVGVRALCLVYLATLVLLCLRTNRASVKKVEENEPRDVKQQTAAGSSVKLALYRQLKHVSV